MRFIFPYMKLKLQQYNEVRILSGNVIILKKGQDISGVIG